MRSRVIQVLAATAVSVAVVSTLAVASAQASSTHVDGGSPVATRLTGVKPPPTTGHIPASLRAVAATGTWSCYAQTSLRALANLLWVTPELGYTGDYYGELRATASAIGGPLQQYTFCYNSGGFWTFFNDANNDLVSTEIDDPGIYNGMLNARATSVGSWEKYNLYCYGTARNLVIQSQANGLYVSTEIGDGGGDYAMLRARASVIGPWEQYINTEQFC
jgi:hypothetical protein